jgi:hypothetical protein
MMENYVASLNGPIIFTAPHSTRIYRGGPETNDKPRLHLREFWTSTLALKFAQKI